MTMYCCITWKATTVASRQRFSIDHRHSSLDIDLDTLGLLGSPLLATVEPSSDPAANESVSFRGNWWRIRAHNGGQIDVGSESPTSAGATWGVNSVGEHQAQKENKGEENERGSHGKHLREQNEE
ncbi:hypothetical protein Ae201684P_018981 [Aphanomyces euteiches]|uniref:Uncharacterized protein n=1 Tax=Aphanomyces euteiches TaxID=100861 RepID=A0A6G0XWI4_9STRA|nr:hypothetical protein Ae201684_000726 [Aphanomyces euteiches]KAH9099975.1 hypothetical protein Ae201684P_018981 [Aphanomyces euteiches]